MKTLLLIEEMISLITSFKSGISCNKGTIIREDRIILGLDHG